MLLTFDACYMSFVSGCVLDNLQCFEPSCCYQAYSTFLLSIIMLLLSTSKGIQVSAIGILLVHFNTT
jgi:hypothetical protein